MTFWRAWINFWSLAKLRQFGVLRLWICQSFGLRFYTLFWCLFFLASCLFAGELCDVWLKCANFGWTFCSATLVIEDVGLCWAVVSISVGLAFDPRAAYQNVWTVFYLFRIFEKYGVLQMPNPNSCQVFWVKDIFCHALAPCMFRSTNAAVSSISAKQYPMFAQAASCVF